MAGRYSEGNGDIEACGTETSISPPRRRRAISRTPGRFPVSPSTDGNSENLSSPQKKIRSEHGSPEIKSIPSSLQVCETSASDGSSPSEIPTVVTIHATQILENVQETNYYDSKMKMEIPLHQFFQRLLLVTELPFLILWVYFSYWAVIVTFNAVLVPKLVWLTATIAGVLVGIALNANAYRYVFARDRIDYVTAVRFFLIPFGVASLTGITNSLREKFLMVFPADPWELAISLICPTVSVIFFFSVRMVLLWRLKVRWCWRVIFFNGSLVE